jgi:hypothetical protein
MFGSNVSCWATFCRNLNQSSMKSLADSRRVIIAESVHDYDFDITVALVLNSLYTGLKGFGRIAGGDYDRD